VNTFAGLPGHHILAELLFRMHIRFLFFEWKLGCAYVAAGITHGAVEVEMIIASSAVLFTAVGFNYSYQATRATLSKLDRLPLGRTAELLIAP
jgi:hypothetical protein